MFDRIEGQSACGSGCGVTKPVRHITVGKLVQGQGEEDRWGKEENFEEYGFHYRYTQADYLKGCAKGHIRRD